MSTLSQSTKLISLVLVFLCAPVVAQQLWTESTIMGTPVDNAKTAFGVYVWQDGSNPSLNVPRRPLPPDQWHTIDLNDDLSQLAWPVDLPEDTKAIVLAGLVGSSGAIGVYCGMTATFRAIGSSATEYTVQAVASVPGGAYRQNSSVVVPLRNRRFEFFWHAADLTCPMFAQFTIQQYFRGGEQSVAPSVTASDTGPIAVTVDHGPGLARDWVSLCATTTCQWFYLNNLHTPPVTGMTSATVMFPRPASGIYQVRFYRNDSFTLLASSAVVVP